MIGVNCQPGGKLLGYTGKQLSCTPTKRHIGLVILALISVCEEIAEPSSLNRHCIH